MKRGRPHLAVALLCSMTIAGLLWIALASAPAEPSAAAPAPRLYDQPFRGP